MDCISESCNLFVTMLIFTMYTRYVGDFIPGCLALHHRLCFSHSSAHAIIHGVPQLPQELSIVQLGPRETPGLTGVIACWRVQATNFGSIPTIPLYWCSVCKGPGTWLPLPRFQRRASRSLATQPGENTKGTPGWKPTKEPSQWTSRPKRIISSFKV